VPAVEEEEETGEEFPSFPLSLGLRVIKEA